MKGRQMKDKVITALKALLQKSTAATVTVFDDKFKGFTGAPPTFSSFDLNAKFFGDGPGVTIRGDFDPDKLFFGITNKEDVRLISNRLKTEKPYLVIQNKKYYVSAIDLTWSGIEHEGMMKLSTLLVHK